MVDWVERPRSGSRFTVEGENISKLFDAAPRLKSEWSETNTLDPDKITPGSHLKADWVGQCGHVWTASVKNRVNGSGCPVCCGKLIVPGVNDLASQIPELAAEWSPNNGRSPKEVSAGSSYQATWMGPCGHEWVQRVHKRASRGDGCPYCASAGTKILPGFNDLATRFPEVAKEWSPRNELSAREVFPKSGKTYWWVGACGHEWKSTIANRTHNKSRCPYCGTHNPKTLAGFNDLATTHPRLAAEWHPDNKRRPSEFTFGSGERVKWLCSKGHEWVTQILVRGQGSNCPSCSLGGSSLAEKELSAHISSLGFEVRNHHRQINPRYEFDITVPEQAIAIEFNGVYWHQESMKGANYHLQKTQAANEAGWQVIHVWEDDWMDRPDVVKEMLAHKLGVSSGTKYNARSLQVSEVSSWVARQFLEQHHIQGSVPGSVRLGLWDGETLVALMVLRSRGNEVWELSRYATNGIVRGGFSKLLKAVVKKTKAEKIVTFSDNAVSDGSLYESTGFVQDGEIKPDYMYVVKNQRVHKFNYRIKRFREDPELQYEEGLTERELAALNNIPRIYDAGKIRWVLNVPDSMLKLEL